MEKRKQTKVEETISFDTAPEFMTPHQVQELLQISRQTLCWSYLNQVHSPVIL